TRFSRDWSSDVCSSDLLAGFTRPTFIPAGESVALLAVDGGVLTGAGEQLAENLVVHRQQSAVALVALAALVGDLAQTPPVAGQQIGRAACRERVGGAGG